MSAQERDLASEQEARAVAEAAREKEWEQVSFARGLFEGRFRLDLVHPHPEPDPTDEAKAEPFLAELREFVSEELDGDTIDREGRVPPEVIDGLAELGCFGMKIPEEYGGLGLSQRMYNRALGIVGSVCGATAAWLSAHQSIGVPQPLKLFGTEEQKKRYLPRCAAGAVSAFALTEADVGSDPANLTTSAEPTGDGSAYILNGEKLWTTNGPDAELLVVMARTPAPEEGGRPRISAFIVETEWEGVAVSHECDFMGIRGISNGILTFDDVRVPAENLLWGEGKGLKLALITLNTGRLSIPAICAAGCKVGVQMARTWASERHQWGQAIGKHDAIAQKLASMTAKTFAMEAVVELTSAMADDGRFDIRLEAALAKMYNSEVGWEIMDDLMQIRGGRGYETADSLRARGEVPMPVERMLRDMRINMIFEGSSEIMRLFIAREAVDTHLEVAGDAVNPKASMGTRVGGLVKAGLHYAWWYPSRFLGWGYWPRYSEFGDLAGHVRYIDRASRRLSRALFHAMVRFGPALEKKQAVLGRLVEIGAELFAMTATCVRARHLLDEDPSNDGPRRLADLFCGGARRRIAARFGSLFDNEDAENYALAREVLDGEHAWLEDGIVDFFEGQIEEGEEEDLEMVATPTP